MEGAGETLFALESYCLCDLLDRLLRSAQKVEGYVSYVLMHEIGHHMIERGMRTADHERRADAFAAACRSAWEAA